VHLLETFIRNLIEDARYRKPQVLHLVGWFIGTVWWCTDLQTYSLINCSQLILIILKDIRTLHSTYSVSSQILVMLDLWYLRSVILLPGFLLHRSNNPHSSAISPSTRHIALICSYNFKLQPTRCNVFLFIYFYRHSTCFRRFLRPSSGADNCRYRFRYCQPILLLAATVEEMEVPSPSR
jgi:hypothetical protein